MELVDIRTSDTPPLNNRELVSEAAMVRGQLFGDLAVDRQSDPATFVPSIHQQRLRPRIRWRNGASEFVLIDCRMTKVSSSRA
jgi:hypothetical protein